jgi:hypothetical protein
MAFLMDILPGCKLTGLLAIHLGCCTCKYAGHTSTHVHGFDNISIAETIGAELTRIIRAVPRGH